MSNPRAILVSSQTPVLLPGQAGPAIQAEDMFGTSLLVWATDAFGLDSEGRPNVLDWDPETVWLECRDRLGSPLPEANYNRLMAAISVITTDLPWKDAAAFSHVANVLCGAQSLPGVYEPAEPDEIAWAVTEMMLLAPPERDEQPFGREVCQLVRLTLKSFGFAKPPAVLAGMADNLSVDGMGNPSIMGAQYERAKDTDRAVTDSLKRLFDQIEHLPMTRLSTRNVRQGLMNEIREIRQRRAN